MTTVSRLALFVSHHAGHAVLGEAIGMPGVLRVVLVATDDPKRPCCNTPARLWRHGWDEELRRLVPRLAAEAGLDTFTGSVRRPGGEFHRRFEAARPDALLATVFGQRIPMHLLERVEGRAWNIHPVVPGLSLAATRGPRPFEIAYELGAREIQLCLHRMTEAFDDGEEVARSEPLPLPSAREPTPDLLLELQRRTAPLSAALVRRSLPALLAPGQTTLRLAPAPAGIGVRSHPLSLANPGRPNR